MLAAGVLVHRVCKPLSLLGFLSFVCRVVRGVFYFFEGSENFLKPFLSCGWTDTLFAKLGFEGWLERFGNVCGCMRWLVIFISD